jgi:hypothetical protein
MKKHKSVVLVALMLISAMVVVAAPAFATPNLTASSGSDATRPHSRAAVAPFITPSTNTRSQFTGIARPAQIIIPQLGATISCDRSNLSGYVSTTHTQLRITSMTFSDNCSITPPSPGSPVTNQPVSCRADSVTPWFWHVRGVTNTPAVRSASGTINIPAGETCTFTVLLGVAGFQSISIDPNQSCRASANTVGVTYTFSRIPAVLDVTCQLVVTAQPLRVTFFVTMSARYTLVPDTARDGSLTVTSSS